VNGELSFLLDSIQRPYNFQGSPNDLFKQFINNHNNQVEETKKFTIRNVKVPDSNNYINRENSNYSNTWDAVNDKLINLSGGNLETGPLENGKRYIDYIAKYTHINSQVIQFGENLLDITQYAKGENIKTAIIPLGKDKLTISSVNNGNDYIYDEIAVNLFGWIWDTVEHNDVTLPGNLLAKGQQYLSSVINESITIELSAVDLHHLNCNIEKFKKGDLVRVISTPHNIDKYFQVSKLSLSLDNPKESKLILGQTFSTLTESRTNETKTIKETIIAANDEIEKRKKEMGELVLEIPKQYVGNKTFEEYQTETNKKFSNVLTDKGTIENYNKLLSVKEKVIGDIYKTTDTNTRYVYTKKGWDRLSAECYTKAEIDEMIKQIKGGTS